ncbi:hypothetical protein KKA03_05165 [archaeon]|nr:hypothetical protein [archaeon]
MKWALFLILSFSLFAVPGVLAEEELPPELALYADGGLDMETAAIVLEKLEENKDAINEYLDSSGIPGPVKGFTSGRYNVHIGDDTIGVVMEGGNLEEVAEGGILNPTTDIYADEEVIEKIVNSGDPLEAILEAKKTGELTKEDHGLVPKIKGFFMDITLKILDLVS